VALASAESGRKTARHNTCSRAPLRFVRSQLHARQNLAEALRIALLAEGINAAVQSTSLPARAAALFTVSVRHDEEYEQAVGIREAMEMMRTSASQRVPVASGATR